jgi:hypothetical protein
LSFAAGDVIEASSPTAGALSFAVPSMTTSRVAWNRILDAIDSRDGHALGEHVASIAALAMGRTDVYRREIIHSVAFVSVCLCTGVRPRFGTGVKAKRSTSMSKLRILNTIGRAFRGQSADLTAAPLPARWRDIMNDIDLEEMFVDKRRSDSEHGSPRDLEIEIARALDRLKAS